MFSYQTLLAVALGSAGGGAARFLLAGWVQQYSGTGFPWGTFAVNVLGSFLLGFLAVYSLERTVWSPLVRFSLTTGFLGGFTTFSTFTYETARLAQDGYLLRAFSNISLSLVAGIGAAFLGIAAARMLG
ncbi:MAG: fluoride efflux transporter CrcB [Candidatus Hydrogenedentota bacterium]|nr:MAG: fluoride efflux transporter CrcB [Candidatus Hydrogenedentota bacterium]